MADYATVEAAMAITQGILRTVAYARATLPVAFYYLLADGNIFVAIARIVQLICLVTVVPCVCVLAWQRFSAGTKAVDAPAPVPVPVPTPAAGTVRTPRASRRRARPTTPPPPPPPASSAE